MTKHRLWQIAQWLIAAAVLWWLSVYVRRYWGEIAAMEIHFDGRWLAVGVTLMLASNAMQIALFQYFLRHNGLPLNFLSAWRIYSLPVLGKYVPGKVTAVAALSYLLKEAGLSLPHALAAIVMMNIVALLSGLLVGLALLPTCAPQTSPMVLAICIGTAALSVVAVCSRVFWRMVNWTLARFQRPTLPQYPSRGAMVRLTLGWIAYWFVLGGGLFAMTHCLTPLSWSHAPLLLASFSLSYFISVVAVLAPSGLGVREALLIGMIGPGASPAVATLFAATSRLVTVVADFGMIGVGWMLSRSHPPRPAVERR